MQEPNEQPKESEDRTIVHEPRYLLITALAVAATALLVGGGMWWWMNGKLEAQRQELEREVASIQENPEYSDSASGSEIDASFLNIYTNDAHGFTMRYPADWGERNGWFAPQNIIDEKERISRESQGAADYFNGWATEYIVHIEVVDEHPQPENTEWISVTSHPIIVGGVSGTRYQEEVVQETLGLFPRGKKSDLVVLPLEGQYISMRLYDMDYADTFNKILSSFELLDTDEVSAADWKTYRNGKYGYSIRYPDSYTLFKDTDQNSQTVVLPDENSAMVKLTDNEPFLFCCEAFISSIAIEQGEIGASDWRNYVNIPDYRVTKEREITFKGYPAYEVSASSGIDSTGSRLVIVYKGGLSYLIVQGAEGAIWDKITDSFEFN